MTSESSEPDDDDQIPLHRELDRIVDEWDDEPTHEKWHKGGKWR